MKIYLIGLVSLALLCSCSFYGTRPDEIKPQAKTLPVPIVKPEPSPGSVWLGESSRNMLFTDNKARYVNDIVTIIIDESSSGQNQASTNTSKNSASNSDISAFLGMDTSITQCQPQYGREDCCRRVIRKHAQGRRRYVSWRQAAGASYGACGQGSG